MTKKLSMNKGTAGALLCAAGGMCWGLSGSMGQYLFTRQGMDSRWLVPLRLGLAGVILFIYCLVRYGRKVAGPLSNRADLLRLIVYGLLGVSTCQFAYFLCIQLSSAAMGTILQDLSPVFILMVTCIREHRKPLIKEVIAILLAFAGVLLLATHGSIENLLISMPAIIAGVVSAVCVMIYNCSDRLISKYPVALLQAYSFIAGGIVYSLICRSWTIHYIPNAVGIFGIVFVVIVGNVLAFTLYIRGVSYIGPDRGILYGFLEPVTAAVITVTVFHAKATVFDLVGFALIFIMLLLISRRDEPVDSNCF